MSFFKFVFGINFSSCCILYQYLNISANTQIKNNL
ncbi:unnamed protein product [Paramecium octaurelia]|uniref:Uncharacterized protein n=1 Tax=Paramecium octaurelia TaxID=43137 RepID=A0A8S1X7I4_PAROT|nr:unnamed protein product [Paramecium octaurelia]